MKDLKRLAESLNSVRHEFILPSEYVGRSVVETLTRLLPQISEAQIYERFEIGGIYINGRSCHENLLIQQPCRIEYFEIPCMAAGLQEFFPSFTTDWIIYRDDYYAIAYKPHRLPTLPTREQKKYNLQSYLASFFSPEIHLPSRLDTSTKGLLLTSLNPDTHNLFQQIFEKRQIEKTYLLKTTVLPEWEDLIVDEPIGKDADHPILRKVRGAIPKDAVTVFKNLGDGLIRVTPKTGRTHQIRVHASYSGIPIDGDNFYGGAVSDELHLLSYSLRFEHPLTKALMHHEIPNRLMPSWAKGRVVF